MGRFRYILLLLLGAGLLSIAGPYSSRGDYGQGDQGGHGYDSGGQGKGGPGDGGPGNGGPGDGGPGNGGSGNGGQGNHGRGPGGGGPGGHPHPYPGQPPATNGAYTLTVGGFCKGTGSGTVGGGTVSITANVVDEAGGKSTLSAPSLTIYDNHFTGAGTVFGTDLTVTGRLDSPDADDAPAGSAGNGNPTRPARIVATFVTADGRRGRIVGFVTPANGQSNARGRR